MLTTYAPSLSNPACAPVPARFPIDLHAGDGFVPRHDGGGEEYHDDTRVVGDNTQQRPGQAEHPRTYRVATCSAGC